MVARVLDGVATASAIKEELKARIGALRERDIVPGLGTLLVGEDPGSLSYVGGKHRDSAEVGIESIRVDLPATASEAEVRQAIAGLNADPAVTGYIVQLPLPAGIDETAMLELIDPAKDADGLHPMNLGRLVLGVDGPLPCTPVGCNCANCASARPKREPNVRHSQRGMIAATGYRAASRRTLAK